MSVAQILVCMAIVMTSSMTTCACVIRSTQEEIVKLKWTPATRTTVKTGLFVNLCITSLLTSATAMGLVSKVIFYELHRFITQLFPCKGGLLLSADNLCKQFGPRSGPDLDPIWLTLR